MIGTDSSEFPGAPMSRSSTGGVAAADWRPVPEETARRYRELGYWTDDLLGDLARPSPGVARRTAVVDARRRWTYQRLDREAEALARAWLDLGVGPGDTAVVQLPNCAEFVAVLLSLWRVGAVPVMTLPAHRDAELRDFAHHSGARLYISSRRAGAFDQIEAGRRLASAVPGLAHVVVPDAPESRRSDGPGETEGTPTSSRAPGGPLSYPDLIDQWSRAARAERTDRPWSPPWRLDPRDVALLQLSGGSTGTPKLIPRTHADYLYSVRTSIPLCGVGPESVYLCCLPCAHNFAMSSAGILGQLMVGGTVVMAPDPSPATAFRLIEREGVTHAALVPPMALLWLARAAKARRPGSADPLASLRVLQVGGARLPREVARRIEPELGCLLQQVFGMAEGLVCYTRLDDPQDVVTGTQGRPMSPEDEIRVVDNADRDVPDGAQGHLLTRGPYTIRGYFRAAEHNAAAFTPDGFYRTGDIVVRDARGNLTVVGRAKEQINRGGEKISSGDLENHLQAHPDVFEAAVTGESDPLLGERVVAHLVLNSQDASARWRAMPPGKILARLRDFLAERSVATYKMPDRVLLVDSIPRTAVGKTSTAGLKGARGGGAPTAPRTAQGGSGDAS